MIPQNSAYPASHRAQHHGRQFRITLIPDSQARSTEEFDFHSAASAALLRPVGDFRLDQLPAASAITILKGESFPCF